MKVGLFFGSFNPIHIGHLIIANHIANTYADKIWFVVSPQNPLKSFYELLKAEKRFDLVQISIKNDKRFQVSDIEFKLPAPSYTINTITNFKQTFPQNDFYIILGSDNFMSLNKWKDHEKILNERLLIYERPGFPVNTNQSNSNIKILNAPLLNISASEIRRLIAKNKSIRYMVSESVYEKIKREGYYKLK